MAFERIDIARARQLIDGENATVVDIRDPASFHGGHIEQAIHVDQNNVAEFVEKTDKSLPLIVCCYHGNMSQGAADYFNRQGFERAYSLDGGYSEWSKQV